MMMLSRSVGIVAGLAVSVGLGVAVSVAGAAERGELPTIHASSPVETSDWALQVTPYMWAAGVKGDVSPFRLLPTVRIEKSFPEILKDLNFGGFINLWARKGRFVFSLDAMYVDETESKVVGRLPVIGPIPPLRASVDTTVFNATVQGGYRFLEAPGFTLDALAGARVYRLTTGVNLSFLNRNASIGSRFGWVDPVVGARAFYRINERLSVLAQGDIGGFGVGSRFSWQLLGTVNYDLTQRISASAGYKVLSVDYRSGGHVYKTVQQGPVLGLTYRF